MPSGCRYFQVTEAFRYYRTKGRSLSNAYYGSSRLTNTVYEAVNAKPGTVFHALPGGLFAVEKGGKGYEAALNAPKPPFEKSYGVTGEADQLAAMAKRGRVTEIPEPANRTDYNAIRKSCDVKLRDLMEQVIEVDASPEKIAFDEELWPVLEMLKGAAAEFRGYDHTLSPTVGVVAKLRGGGAVKIEHCYLPDFYRVTKQDVPPGSEADAIPAGDRLTAHDIRAALNAEPSPSH